MLQKNSIICQLLIVVSLLILAGISVDAQDRWLDETGAPLASIEHLILPYLDNEELKEKNKWNGDSDRIPNVFAETIIQNINAEKQGFWESTAAGHLLWRQRITSVGAYSLNLGFKKFYLPPSAALFVYDVEKTFVVGPITQEDNDFHEEWWTPIIPSDDLIIELQIAPEEKGNLKLTVSAINHDFSGLGSVISGSCNLDVVCGAEDGFDIVDRFREVIDGVGMIMVEGRVQCTGTLINNTRKDCIPYVLTAEHCGISESSAASVLVYWNFQNSQCRQPGSQESGEAGDGVQMQFNSGASLISKYDQSDFTLLELDDPVNPDYNPFFVGWDRNTEMVDSAFAIHHPTGDEKRISFDFDTLTFNVDRNFVRVHDWDIGTTERGSSGGPLFNFNAHIIGALTGGDASCNNDEYDEFGMFKKSWEGGGTPETSLKPWLDPLNTGQNTLDGRYCTDVALLDINKLALCTQRQTSDTVLITATAGYEEGGTIRLANATNGLSVRFSDTIILTGQTIQLFIEITQQFEQQSGEVLIRIDNEQGSTELSVTVEVFEDIPLAPDLTLPRDGTTGLDFEVQFEWESTAPSYILELSERPDFSGSVVTIENILTNNLTLKDLLSTTTYFWRVRGNNECGKGDFSATNSFTTGSIVCLLRNPSDLPKEIGEDAITVTSVITIEDVGTVSDINVLNVTGKHTWVSDLTMTLTSPSGITVTLVQTPCSEEDDFLVSFDDSSENINLDCPLTTGRRFKPVEALSLFNGESATGDWILSVIDGVSFDGGSFDDWTLEICVNKTETKSFIADPSFIELCDKNPEPISLTLQLNDAWTNPVNPMASTGSGLPVAASFSPDPIAGASEILMNIDNPSALIGVNEIVISFEDGQDVISSELPVIHVSDVRSPTLVSPDNGADRIELTPTFTWKSEEEGKENFVFTLATDPQMMDLVATISVVEDTVQLNEELEELTTYYWQVTAEGICSDSSSTISSFTTDQKTDVIDLTLSEILIYPSPANEWLSIDLKEFSHGGNLRYELWSSGGRRIAFGRLTQEVNTLDVSQYSSGLYLLSLISPEGVFVHKVVLQH